MQIFKKIQLLLLKNGSANQTIAKNTFWLFAGQMISRLLRAAIVIYAARVLGSAGWGAFSYALSIATFLTIFSDFGINALVTREASKNPELKNRYLSTALVIKMGLVAILALIVFTAGSALTNIEAVKVLMPLVVLMFAFDTIRELATTVTRALERMEIEAFLVVITNFLIVVLGFLFLIIAPTPSALAASYAAGSALGLLISLFALRRHLQNIFSYFDRALVKNIIMLAWPFGLLALLGIVMLNTDIIMLGWMRTVEEVGFYATAQKPIQLLYVIPALIATAFFPSLSKLAADPTQKTSFEKIVERSLAVTTAIALPITVGGLLVSEKIIFLLFGSGYQQSVMPFAVLLLSLPIVFPSIIISNALFADNRQRDFIGYVALGAGTNFLANWLLIPPYGIVGAAAATIMSNLISNILLWFKMRLLARAKFNLFLMQPLAATAIMAAGVFILDKYKSPLILTVAAGGTLYIFLMRKFIQQKLMKN